MTKTAKNGTEILVALDKLKKSPKNVRRVPHAKADIEALAASIAAKGLLQNLVVEPELGEKDKPTGFYLVTIGEGRRLALLLRAQRKEIRKNEPVRCMLDTDHDATEISLAENVVRTAMHPADEYAAFAELSQKGMPADDIAARFGVTAAVVRQRLKLGAVSPKLLNLYREGEANLEQMMALTLTDDHARQEQVWEAAGDYRNAHTLRQMLTEGQVQADDRRVLLVGLDVYEAAGGIVMRDLFNTRHEGYLTDVPLLEKLVSAKLNEVAAQVQTEGWAWVVAHPDFDHHEASGMRRVYPDEPVISEEAEQEIETLSARMDALAEAIESGEGGEAEEAEVASLEERIAALQGEPVYAPEHIKVGGAFVAVAYDGTARIERGFIRRADEPLARTEEAMAERPEKGGLSGKMVVNLAACRTGALRDAVSRNIDVALLALVHVLAIKTFYPYANNVSPLDVRLGSSNLATHVAGFDETVAGRAAAEQFALWDARLPDDVDLLWDAIATMPDGERMNLLAYCAARTIDGVVAPGMGSAAATKMMQTLCGAVALDMRQYWRADADSYLKHVPKPLILEAVREGASEGAAAGLADLKKADMARTAEALLATSGWLPSALRA